MEESFLAGLVRVRGFLNLMVRQWAEEADFGPRAHANVACAWRAFASGLSRLDIPPAASTSDPDIEVRVLKQVIGRAARRVAKWFPEEALPVASGSPGLGRVRDIWFRTIEAMDDLVHTHLTHLCAVLEQRGEN